MSCVAVLCAEEFRVGQQTLQTQTNAAPTPGLLQAQQINLSFCCHEPSTCGHFQVSPHNFCNHQPLSSPQYKGLVLSLLFLCWSSDPARVVNMPSVIYVAIGLPGFIRCSVNANPPVTLVKWKKDGLPLRIDKVTWCCSFGWLKTNCSYIFVRSF